LQREWFGYGHFDVPVRYGYVAVPGWWDAPVVQKTLDAFLGLGVGYGVVLLLLWRTAVVRWWMLLPLAAGTLAALWFAVGTYPMGALDFFNYLAELKLAFHWHQNPYLTTLAPYTSLDDPFVRRAFMTDVRLFYGPAWLLTSWLPGALVGWDAIVEAMRAYKLFNALLLLATAIGIAAVQATWPARLATALLFLANPLVILEGVANGHNDVLMTAYLIAACVALKQRSPLAGPLLALSALVKAYCVALLPIFIVVTLKDRWGWRRIVLTVGLTLATVVPVVAPYWADGELVDGFQDGLRASQEMDHVSLLSLAQQWVQNERADAEEAVFPARADAWRMEASFEVVPEETQERLRLLFGAVLVLGSLLIAETVRRGRPWERGAAEVMLLVLLCATNLYGWYLIPVIALVLLRRDRLPWCYVGVATLLGLVYYPVFVWVHFEREGIYLHRHLILSLFLTVPILAYLAATIGETLWHRHRRNAVR
jgi:hypothetical protein